MCYYYYFYSVFIKQQHSLSIDKTSVYADKHLGPWRTQSPYTVTISTEAGACALHITRRVLRTVGWVTKYVRGLAISLFSLLLCLLALADNVAIIAIWRKQLSLAQNEPYLYFDLYLFASRNIVNANAETYSDWVYQRLHLHLVMNTNNFRWYLQRTFTSIHLNLNGHTLLIIASSL